MRVIDRYVIAHVLDHPARGRPWSLRDLASRLGCSHSTLGHLKSGERTTVDAELATRFAQAVGCQTAVLFMPVLSSESDDEAAA